MGGVVIKHLPRYAAGYAATGLSAYYLVMWRSDLAIVATSIYFILACLTDTHKAKIPNVLNLSLAVAGVGINVAAQGWGGLVQSLLGMALGIGLLLIPYIMGGFGAGDVKALGALGAIVGPAALLHVFIYMAFCGGAMAVLHYLANRNLAAKAQELWLSLKTAAISRSASELVPGKKEPLRFPYATAIAFGYYAHLAFGKIHLVALP